MKNNLKKNFILNSIGSTIYSFTSLFFLIIVTRINGINEAGLFSFAFSNACFLQVIGIYVSRTYQVTEKDKKTFDSDFIYSKIISCIAMLFVGMSFCLIKGYGLLKIIVIMLLIFFKALDAFSESIYAIIQKNDELYKVGISLILKGVVATVVFIVVDILTKNIIFSILSLIVSIILIIIFYDFLVVKKYDFKLKKINVNIIKKIFVFGFWTFLFSFLTQYLINAPKYAIDNYLSNDLQTIYGIISMPATIMILVTGFIIHPFLLKINDCVDSKKYKKLNDIVIKMSLAILVIDLFGLLLCYFIGIPILNMMYGIRLEKYLNSLLIIILGSGLFAITLIISNALIAMRKTMSQTIIYIIVSIIAFFLTKILVKNYMIVGAAYSYLTIMLLLLLLYIFLYIYIIDKEKKR